MKNYAAYYILDIKKNVPIYVGISNDVHRRFRQHFNDPQDILYQFHTMVWDELFQPVIIKENITKSWASDIETKYIIDFQRQGYTLFNTVKVKTPTDCARKPSLNSKQVRCIETNEIFDSQREAQYKYNITYKRLLNACTYGDSAGINEDLQPLHWQFIPHTGYIQKRVKTNTIYKIEQLINDIWTPIYIGVTNMKLKDRLISHRINCSKNESYNHKLAQLLCKNDWEYFYNHFRISAIYEGIIDRREAFELEAKTTEKYRDKYDLLNINTGAHEATEKSIKSARMKKQFYNTKSGKLHKDKLSHDHTGGTNAGAKSCICLETQNRFVTCSAAAKFINASCGLITEACRGTIKTAKKLHFAYLDEKYRIANELKWIIFLLKNNDKTYIFYEPCNNITLKDIVLWDKYKYLIHDNNTNIQIIKICNNKAELCNSMPDILKNYKERLNINDTQAKNIIAQINNL